MGFDDAPEVAHYDFIIPQGIDVKRFFALKHADGSLRDTAGYTVDAQVRATLDSATVLLRLSTTTLPPPGGVGNGRITVGIQGTAPDQYNIALTLPKSATQGVADWGRGVWDMEITDGTGNTFLRIAGASWLSREVTR